MFSFGSVSLGNLKGVHPDLVELATRVIAISPIDFRVVDGLRTLAEEKKFKAKGASQTLNSMHLKQKDGFSHAIDFAVWYNGAVNFLRIDDFKTIGHIFETISPILHIPIAWGGDWHSLKDYGHIELDRRYYLK